MSQIIKLIHNGLLYIVAAAVTATRRLTHGGTKSPRKEVDYMKIKKEADKSILISESVLDAFRKDVGRYRAETGGMLASSTESSIIDICYFDKYSNNTSGTFYYDIETMSAVFREWKAKGYITNGIYHSHPKGVIRPSYHDISSALLHIDFFGLDYFYLPILQPTPNGLFTLYFYVVRKEDESLVVTLQYVVKATESGYEYPPFHAWVRHCSIKNLRFYLNSISSATSEESEGTKEGKTLHPKNSVRKSVRRDQSTAVDPPIGTDEDGPICETAKESMLIDPTNTENTFSETVQNTNAALQASISIADDTCCSECKDQYASGRDYFAKVSTLYPQKVLNKVIVCIGTGGARSFLENMARGGFRNFVLMDADVVSPSNIATQGVFISEIGRKKVEVIRDRIIDINPDAQVICVDRFLDNNMSDEEFKSFLDVFPGMTATDYLILGCTDNFEAQKRSSLLALKYGMPYLAAMMYEGGAAAEIIFVYPGVTESCPRCLLRDRFEKYESGFVNDVDSSACPIFATERMNSLKGYIALMLLMYHEDPENPFCRMLDDVKNRNFVEIRLTPYLKDTKLGIGLFDRVFAGAARYVFFDESIWIPQHPDSEKYGEKPCKLCGGTGDLTALQTAFSNVDTRNIQFK